MSLSIPRRISTFSPLACPVRGTMDHLPFTPPTPVAAAAAAANTNSRRIVSRSGAPPSHHLSVNANTTNNSTVRGSRVQKNTRIRPQASSAFLRQLQTPPTSASSTDPESSTELAWPSQLESQPQQQASTQQATPQQHHPAPLAVPTPQQQHQQQQQQQHQQQPPHSAHFEQAPSSAASTASHHNWALPTEHPVQTPSTEDYSVFSAQRPSPQYQAAAAQYHHQHQQQPTAPNVSTAPAPDHDFGPTLNSDAMSSIGYMLPTQYHSLEPYSNPVEPSSYTMQQHSYRSPAGQEQQTPATYAPSFTLSPTLMGSPSQPNAPQHTRPQQPPLDTRQYRPESQGTAYGAQSASSAPSSISRNLSYPTAASEAPAPRYIPALEQPMNYYGSNYSRTAPSPAGYPQQSPHTPSQQQYLPSFSQSFQSTPYSAASDPSLPASTLPPTPGTLSAGGAGSVRVLNSRPKPQCWDHGCNGRQFSTFSNLLRHQREKSGTATKSYCPKCGAEFTRTTARNGHLAHEKCSKQRRASGDAR